MTTVAARLYHDGKVAQEIDLAKPIPHITQPKDFIWIGLHEPDDGALKRVQDHFGLHPLAVEDALDPKHLPKVDVYGDHLFLVIRTPKLEGDRIVYGNTDFHGSPVHHHGAPWFRTRAQPHSGPA